MTPPPQQALPSLVEIQKTHRDSTELPLLRCHANKISETVAPAADTKHQKNKRLRPVDATPPKESETLRATHAGATPKPSYVLQREARERLADEVRALESQLKALRMRAGLPTSDDTGAVDDTKASNREMEEALHQNDLFLSRLNSMVAKELCNLPVNPMSSFIHLPRDMSQRRAILRSMQDLKLRRGIEVGLNLLGGLDHSMPFVSEDRFIGYGGEYHSHRLEIDLFPNFKSARQLFDVFFEFMYNLDVSVTGFFGQLTVREETEDFDTKIWNHRIVTMADDVGCEEELNVVGFANFYDYSPHTHSPMGVVVYDTVNIDDLYPYLPMERTCKDYQGVTLIYERRNPDSNTVVVIMKRVAYAVQLVPQFPISPAALQQLQDNTSRWPKQISKYLHDYAVPLPAGDAA